MGRTHATSGAVAFLAVVPLLPQAGLPLTPLTVPVAALAAAGAATLPDLDHPRATVSHSLGPATVGLARLVAWCIGGHRGGTHSLLAVVAFSGGAAAVDLAGALPRGLACAFLFALATAAVQLRPARLLLHTTTASQARSRWSSCRRSTPSLPVCCRGRSPSAAPRT